MRNALYVLLFVATLAALLAIDRLVAHFYRGNQAEEDRRELERWRSFLPESSEDQYHRPAPARIAKNERRPQ